MQSKILSVLKHFRKQDSQYRKIRVGTPGDGGYVIPDDLENIDAVLSLGIGADTSFDEYFANRGVDVFQYDPTVNGPPTPHERFHFRKIGLGPQDTGLYHTLPTMIKENGLQAKNNLILKMDIENGEWPAFDVLSYTDLMRFRMIVAELHDLYLLAQEPYFKTAQKVIEMIARNHVCVHFHANNYARAVLVHGIVLYQVVEVTFLRKDRSTFTPSTEPIPSALDYPNKPGVDDYIVTAFG
ncbi:MAG: hypothetical protein HQL88_05325 [Magnetococcales bacterium]|nr:hypothetical protein [Magnetococcales bacterium]